MWSNLDKNARIGLLAAIAVLFTLTAVVLIWVFSVNNSNLFSDLDEKEASNVILALEEMKIPYELSKGGKDISVDDSVVEEVRLKLVGKGVRIQSEDGFELFNDADIGMTEYSQKINYLRAMQGELARSIMSIDGIKYARVHLVLPETSVFKQKKHAPSASVTVIPEAGFKLSNEQILGIQRMLAAATPGVIRENVTVVDNNGVTISNTQNESDKDQITSMLLKKKREAESYMEDKVNLVLNRAFNKGDAVVTVSVDLVIDKIHRKEEIVLPQNSKNDGMFRKRETNTGEKKEKSKNNNNSIEVEYQLSKRIEEIISMPGAIGRISVGVIVPEYTNSEKVAHLRKIISMAVGLDVARGDDVAIYPMKTDLLSKVKVNVAETKFTSNSVAKIEKDDVQKDNKTQEIIPYMQLLYISAGLMVLVIFFVLRLIYSFLSTESHSRKDLSIGEKEKLLSELKAWAKEGAV